MQENKQQWSGLAEDAQIALFWAFYSKLPESYKNGFASLAYSLAKETGCRIQGYGVQPVPSDPELTRNKLAAHNEY